MSKHEHEWEISIGGNYPNLEADAICARGRDLECVSRLSEEEVERRLNAHAALEAKLSKMEEALKFIAFTGTDCPAGYERDSFYRGQLHGAIAAAANALAAEEEAR